MIGRALAACFALSACGDPVSHVFAGRLYEPARDCVDETSSIDVVDGKPNSAPCERECLVAPAEGGRSSVCVSTMCAPYPRGFEIRSSTECAAALDAFDRNDTCFTDGGSAHPANEAAADAMHD